MTNNPEFSHPEQITSFTPETRHAAKRVEIIRNPKNTIILNNEARAAIWGAKIADVIADGVPATWQPQVPTHKNVVVGDIEGKLFLAKTKRHKLDTELMSQLRAKPPEAQAGWEKTAIKSQLAFASILSELHLSTDVRSIIESESVQDLAKSLGLKGLSFVEPLAGIITQSTDEISGNPSHEKTLLYEYIPGAHSLDSPEEPLPPEAATKLWLGLEQSFKEHGIHATDLLPEQIMVDEDRQGYLVDIEGYTRIKR